MSDRGDDGDAPPEGEAASSTDGHDVPAGESDERAADGGTTADEEAAAGGDPDDRAVDPSDRERREVGKGLLDEEMGPSGSLAHLYRGEIHRMRFWRERLDRTTYWAIVIMAAVLTWAFSSPAHPHYVLLAGAVTLVVFLCIEARRFRGYDIWRARVRALQKNVFAYGLDPSQGLDDPDWRAELSSDYRRPTFRVQWEEAVAHRLRRVYLGLLSVVLGAWVVRVTAYARLPFPPSAAIGPVPGVAVVAAVALSYGLALVVAFRPREWHFEQELHAGDDEGEER